MEQFINENFTGLFTVGLVILTIIIVASIVYRLAKRHKAPLIPDQDILFREKWASGASQKNLLTQLGGASNCLLITLTRNALIIRPVFPFNLMFLPEVYDLEHVIPRSAIRSIEFDGPSGRAIVVEFESLGGTKRFQLVLRRREEFRNAIQKGPGAVS